MQMRESIPMKTFSCCNISIRVHKDKGFLLLELLVAVLSLVGMGVVLWALLAQASDFAGRAQHLMYATSCAAQAYERALHEEQRDVTYREDNFVIQRHWQKNGDLNSCIVTVLWHERGLPVRIVLGERNDA